MNKIVKLMAMVALLGATVASCNKSKTEPGVAGACLIDVDESFEKVMDQVIPVFEYIYPKASIIARYLPESQCIDSLMENKTSLIVTTQELTEQQERLLKAQQRNPRSTMIAVDAVAILANKDNPVDQLSVYDLTRILSGEITDWSQIDKGNRSGKIRVIFDYQGSSTISYLSNKLLDGGEIKGDVYAQESNPGVYEAVQKYPGAIGIIGVGWVSADMSKANMTAEELYNDTQKEDVTVTTFAPDVRVLPVAADGEVYGVQPYQAYIFDGSYPLVRKVFMIVTGSVNALENQFKTFVESFEGQKLMQTTGVVPGAMQPRIVQVE